MSFQTVDLTAYWVLLFCRSASPQSKQWLSSNHRPHYPHMIKPTRSHAMSLLLIIWCHPLQDSHSHNEVHGDLLDHISTIMIITIIVLIIGYINPPRHPCMPCSFTWLSTASLCNTWSSSWPSWSPSYPPRHPHTRYVADYLPLPFARLPHNCSRPSPMDENGSSFLKKKRAGQHFFNIEVFSSDKGCHYLFLLLTVKNGTSGARHENHL